MDEILFELKDHSAGLNCGRWDYIFSFIKVFKNHKQFMLPDRGQVTMDRDFLKAYVDLLIKTKCIDNGKKLWWDVRPHYQFDTVEVSGQTMGVIGLGDIGKAVARRGEALGLRVMG